MQVHRTVRNAHHVRRHSSLTQLEGVWSVQSHDDADGRSSLSARAGQVRCQRPQRQAHHGKIWMNPEKQRGNVISTTIDRLGTAWRRRVRRHSWRNGRTVWKLIAPPSDASRIILKWKLSIPLPGKSCQSTLPERSTWEVTASCSAIGISRTRRERPSLKTDGFNQGFVTFLLIKHWRRILQLSHYKQGYWSNKRGRLRQSCWEDQGHDHSWRRKYLPARNRRAPPHPSRR